MTEGDLIGGHRLTRLLGRGGMAEVWEAARLESPSELRALKLLYLDPSENDAAASARRFRDEAWVGMSVAHPNLVRVLEVGVEGDLPFLAMERLEGHTLQQLGEGRALPCGAVAAIGQQALLGLSALHEGRAKSGESLGLIHRDIKPSNLFLTRAGELKIIDFGIARAAALDQTMTRTGAIRGSIPYCSPEQARGEPQDARSDLFQLGLVLAELLTGERCFPQKADFAVISAVLFSPIAPVHLARPEVPRPLSDAIGAMLERAPEARPASAADALRRLQSALPPEEVFTREQLAAWMQAQPVTARQAVATSTRMRPRAPAAALAPAKKHWGLWAVVGTAVVGVAAAALWKPTSPPVAVEPAAPTVEPSPTPVAKPEPAPPIQAPAPRKVIRSKAPELPPGWLTVNTHEGWAQISVDGKAVGPTPVFRLELSPGPHVIHATRPNGETRRQRVVIKSNAESKAAF